jgi:ubiquitin carboxyl-terminal hydrolase 8
MGKSSLFLNKLGAGINILSAPSPTPSSSSSTAKAAGPETTSMGSIADRMKALSGKGMDVGGSDRRMSKDQGDRPPVSAGLSRAGIPTMGQSGNNGPVRTQRSRAGSQVSQHGDVGQSQSQSQKQSPIEGGRSRSSSIKESKPPTVNTNSRPLPSHEEHPHASSSRPPPAIAPKPKLPIPPSQHTTPTQIEPSHTGSSTASTRVNINGHRPESGFITTSPIVPTHSGHTPAPPSAKSSKPPLPPIPQSHTGTKKAGPGPGPETNGLDDFERTFPSLDDFGKQFPEPIPANKSSGTTNGEDESKYAFPEVPSSSFPDLPSVPSSRPGLPSPPGSPPTGFTGLKPPNGHGQGHDSPPNPDVDRETKRPTSQPNLSKLDGRVDPSIGLASPDHPAPTLQDFRTPQLPTPAMSPPSTSPNGSSPQPPLAFPTPQPTPGRRPIPIPQQEAVKPKFPFSNSVNCETLRSYFLNPDVEMILLDVRSEEEHRKGVVGAEYEPKGAKLRVIWMDPTVLMRNE